MDTRLKVKISTLAAEAVIIKSHERRAKRDARRLANHKNGALTVHHQLKRSNLYEHRVNIVRPAARAAHLAACYMRGTPYRACEARHRPGNGPDKAAIIRIVMRFGGDPDGVRAWLLPDGQEQREAA